MAPAGSLQLRRKARLDVPKRKGHSFRHQTEQQRYDLLEVSVVDFRQPRHRNLRLARQRQQSLGNQFALPLQRRWLVSELDKSDQRQRRQRIQLRHASRLGRLHSWRRRDRECAAKCFELHRAATLPAKQSARHDSRVTNWGGVRGPTNGVANINWLDRWGEIGNDYIKPSFANNLSSRTAITFRSLAFITKGF